MRIALGQIVSVLRRRWYPARRRAVGEAVDEGRGPRTAAAIERAMHLGLWEHAERLAATAAPQAPASSRLTERIARLRLLRSKPEVALALIDACGSRPASLRMMRAVCLLRTGRWIEAHLDLLRWAKRSSAPLHARRLLAHLDWHVDDRDAAVQSLLRNLKHLEDPRSLELLMLLSTLQKRPEQARMWARRLWQASSLGHVDPEADMMIRTLRLERLDQRARPQAAHVEKLSAELVVSESVIPALIAVQHRQLHEPTARLLTLAIERALPDLRDKVAAIEGLARLSALCGAHEDARRWAQRGLAINPMSACLARMLRDPRTSRSEENRAAVLGRIEHEAEAPGRAA